MGPIMAESPDDEFFSPPPSTCDDLYIVFPSVYEDFYKYEKYYEPTGYLYDGKQERYELEDGTVVEGFEAPAPVPVEAPAPAPAEAPAPTLVEASSPTPVEAPASIPVEDPASPPVEATPPAPADSLPSGR
jgi:hypothetical protein